MFFNRSFNLFHIIASFSIFQTEKNNDKVNGEGSEAGKTSKAAKAGEIDNDSEEKNGAGTDFDDPNETMEDQVLDIKT